MKTSRYAPNTTGVYTAAPTTFLITWFDGRNNRFLDVDGDEFTEDFVNNSKGFATEADAHAVIDAKNWHNCHVTLRPEWDVLVYRADSYRANMGDLRGFFLSKDDAMHALRVEESEETRNPGDDFEQITCFGVSPDDLDGVDLSDNKAMLNDRIWGAGNIIETFYYA